MLLGIEHSNDKELCRELECVGGDHNIKLDCVITDQPSAFSPGKAKCSLNAVSQHLVTLACTLEVTIWHTFRA
jgi:hypothetical protein